MARTRVELDLSADGALTLRWPGSSPRLISPETIAALDHLAHTLAEAERAQAAGPEVHRDLGKALFALLDGPDHVLTTRFASATVHDPVQLDVVLRNPTRSGVSLEPHPAAAWRWELLADADGHVVLAPEVSVAVQLGHAQSAVARVLERGGLRVLFLASSPTDVSPELDHEAEEERILDALAPHIAAGHAWVHVVEFGSLAALRHALVAHAYDVVHLSGHGLITEHGPRLLMEDQLGALAYVDAVELLAVLNEAMKMPELIVISSCHSAESRDGVPSLTAELVAGGVPAAIGWVQPVRDDYASLAAARCYARLCAGSTPAEAVAHVRRRLHEAERSYPLAERSHTWATLHLVTRDAAGFRVDRAHPRLIIDAKIRETTYQTLGEQGRMRVLAQGFVGRRRPLQTAVRVLLTGREGGARRSGVVIVGNKGTGKSCLAARAIERTALGLADRPDRFGLVVLHGFLDDPLVLAQLEALALEWGDADAGALLRDPGSGETMIERLRELLHGRWKRRRIVFVLDDFEQNLAGSDRGLGGATPYARALLDLLIGACAIGDSSLIVTSAARFALSLEQEDRMVEIPLGPFETGALAKLWTRGQAWEPGSAGELAGLSRDDWRKLCDRLGRNPRILDWARVLLRGATPGEVQALVTAAGAQLPRWTAGALPSAEEQAKLARLFLQHMAYDKAVEVVGSDANEFVQRARVYELTVPRAALDGLVDGLGLDLDLHLPALQNLGLIEMGSFDGEPGYRVSPLIEPEFAAAEPERWHAVAARFWVDEDRHRQIVERVMRGWSHGLAARDETIAGALGQRIEVHMTTHGMRRENLKLARRHLEALPGSEVGLAWLGYGLLLVGKPGEAWAMFEQAERLALARGASGLELSRTLDYAGRILRELGRCSEAADRFSRAMEIEQRPGGNRLHLASLLHELAGVLDLQGEYGQAASKLDGSIAIKHELLGTYEDQNVSTSLGCLAGVYRRLGELTKARAAAEQALAINRKLCGTDEHLCVASSLGALASVLLAQGQIPDAREALERSLAIELELLGTDESLRVAASFHNLAGIYRIEGRLPEAHDAIDHALAIKAKLLGSQPHSEVAVSLHELALVCRAQSESGRARSALEHALAIYARLFPIGAHLNVAISTLSLGQLMIEEGDVNGGLAQLRRGLDLQRACSGEEHYMTAEAEYALAQALFAARGEAEAIELMRHALEVFERQAPNHPLAHRLRQVFGAVPDPFALARLALARRSGSLPAPAQAELDAGIEFLDRAGPPHAFVAAYLRTVASGEPAPTISDELPTHLHNFLQSLADAIA